MKIKTWFVRFLKCSFVLRVGAVIFELDKVSMSNFVKFEFWSMTLKIERVIKKTNIILIQKLAKMAMNLVSKKDHNQCKISYMRKKNIFFVRLNPNILLTTSVWWLKSLLANCPMVWKWCPEIFILNLNLTVLRTSVRTYVRLHLV